MFLVFSLRTFNSRFLILSSSPSTRCTYAITHLPYASPCGPYCRLTCDDTGTHWIQCTIPTVCSAPSPNEAPDRQAAQSTIPPCEFESHGSALDG